MATKLPEEVIDRLKALADLPAEKRSQIGELFAKASIKELLNPAHLETIAKKAQVDPSIIRDGFPATTIVLYDAIKEQKGDVGKCLKELESEKLTPSNLAAIEDIIIKARSNINGVIESHDAFMPSVYIDRYQRMITRIISVSEFDKEFSPFEMNAKYKPEIVKNHPRLLITLFTQPASSENPKSILFTANREAVDNMINHLKLAKIQLGAVIATTEEK